jgi:excisionase family DNA binding protein
MVSLPEPTLPAESTPRSPAVEHDYYSITQAAAVLGVSRVSVWRWISDGRLSASRLGHRTTRIRREDLERLLLEVRPSTPRSWLVKRQVEPPYGPHPTELQLVPGADWRDMRTSEHFVQFYEADEFLQEAVSEFIGEALRAGDAGVVVATQPHRDGIQARLLASGLNLELARERGHFVAVDAAETLAAFMVEEMPDVGRFRQTIGSLLAGAAGERRRARVFGEMVALLASQGNHAATLRLEELWNELKQTHAFSLFCAYPIAGFAGDRRAGLLNGVCHEHTRVLPAESYTSLPDPDERLRVITALQQKAQSLEAEIAQRKRAEEQARAALAAERAAREAAETALRTRDEFLSIAAHELRTPLATLSGHAQLVLRRLAREGNLDEKGAAQALRVIHGQANKLARLLTQLFDISRLEAGQLTLEPQSIDLAALVEQAVSFARSWTDRHEIHLDAPDSLSALVDPLRVEQVLSNLLDNAIKYSPDGGSIEVVLIQPAARVAEVSVRDHGIGIPEDKRGQIFNRYYQAHDDSHRSGMGLGLYICRQIVELHGGQIRAELPADGGTRIVLRLPTELEKAAVARAAAALHALADSEPNASEQAGAA